MTPAPLKTIAVDGISLAVRDEGVGPALVFLHGFPLDHRMWDAQFEAFPTWRLIAPDLRGFGASTVTPGTVTMNRFADDVAGLLDALNLPKAVICGLSMGGYIAMAFWRRHANRTTALILCDTRAIPDSIEAAAGRRTTAGKVLAEGSQVVAEAMATKLFAPETVKTRPELAAEYRARMSGMPPQGVAAAALGMADRPDSRPTLATMNVPVLVVVGTDDAISPPTEMKAIADAIPGAQYALIAGAGHMTPVEQPALVNREIGRFLERLT